MRNYVLKYATQIIFFSFNNWIKSVLKLNKNKFNFDFTQHVLFWNLYLKNEKTKIHVHSCETRSSHWPGRGNGSVG